MYKARLLNGVSASRTRRGSCIAGVTRVNPLRSSCECVTPSSYFNYVRQSAPDVVQQCILLVSRELLTYIHFDLSTTLVCGAVVVVFFGCAGGGCVWTGRVTTIGLIVVCVCTLGVTVWVVVLGGACIVSATSAHVSFPGVFLVVYSAT